MTRPTLADRRTLVIVAVVAVGAALVGAYLDWIWWLPYEGMLITIVGAGLLVVASILATVRRTRQLAILVVATGAGLLAGQNLGPARPALIHTEGSLTVSLTSPRPGTGTVPATCASEASGGAYQVSGDPNLRLDVIRDDPEAPADLDQREFVGIGLSVGDRWDQGSARRPDRIALWIRIGRVEAELPETPMRSDGSSTLVLEGTSETGSLDFAGLVHDPETTEAAGDGLELVGTVTWTCVGG
jgi:hypothetical protein